MVGSGTRKPRSARIEHNQFLLLVWRNVANWSISLPRYTPTFVQSQAAARFSREIDRTMKTFLLLLLLGSAEKEFRGSGQSFRAP